MPNIDGVTLHAVLLRPRAVGWVRLRSADPSDLPLVNPNYLGHPDDVRHLREGMRVAREILARRPAQATSCAKRLRRGRAATSDAALDEHVRRTVKTDYHPVGTCRMGARRRSGRGGRRAAPRARHRRPPRHRRLGHAEARLGQHQRADDGARRPGGVADAGHGVGFWLVSSWETGAPGRTAQKSRPNPWRVVRAAWTQLTRLVWRGGRGTTNSPGCSNQLAAAEKVSSPAKKSSGGRAGAREHRRPAPLSTWVPVTTDKPSGRLVSAG